MRALSAAIGPLLASLLLVASVIAPAQCLARLGPPGERPVELCQPSGLFDAAPAPWQGAHHDAGICVMAASLAAAMLPDPPATANCDASAWYPAALRLPDALAPQAGKFLPAARPRAPPAA